MHLLMAHLVGDFILQNDWQAINKKRRTWPCLVHCALYTLSVFLFTWWRWPALLIVFAAHFVQDRTPIVRWYMCRIGQRQFATGPLSPWSIIVVDNVLHLLLLYLLSLSPLR